MVWWRRYPHAAPLVVLALFTLLDALSGRGQVVYGLLVIVPLVAAFVLGRRSTVGYTLVALAVAALLGIYNGQYTAQYLDTHLLRLAGIALGGVIAVAGCALRLRTEAELAAASAQAAATREALRLTEVLQRSLLTEPPPIPGLRVEVRYLPATRHTQIGGDWYDAFTRADGSTVLVIGDVAGHDASAAATMAQARGMLRGFAAAATTSPAGVLTAVDRALVTLGVPGLTTAVVAFLAAPDRPAPASIATLRWSNAGHPAPVLVGADGTRSVLQRRPEMLLGVSPDATRTDHEVDLRAGETLVLYTDGLVERRGVPLDEGTAWLVGALRDTSDRPLDQVCDQLLEGMAGGVDDDVALLAVRLEPVHRTPGELSAMAPAGGLADGG